MEYRKIPKEFPFAFAYIIDATRKPEIYRLFGASFSMPLLSNTLTGLRTVKFTYANALGCGSYVPALRTPRRVVVPLRIHAHTGETQQWVHGGRLSKEALATLIPGEECLLHLGPKKEDTKPLCALCPNVLNRLMNNCTPGQSICHKHLKVPLDSITPLQTLLPRRARST